MHWAPEKAFHSRTFRLVFLPALLGGGFLASLATGDPFLAIPEMARFLSDPSPGDLEATILLHSRLPRALGALGTGAALGLAGALMQGLTRNPLASPALLGVSDGALLGVTLAMLWVPGSGALGMAGFSFAGSLSALVLVLLLSRFFPAGNQASRLALTGSVTGTFLSGLATGLGLFFQVSQDLGFWFNARMHQMAPDLLYPILPVMALLVLLSFPAARGLDLMALGDDAASGLGLHPRRFRVLGLALACLLTALSVALAGRIAFLGLMVPHLVRFFAGPRHHRVLPWSAVLGAALLVWADTLGRLWNPPFETPVNVPVALLGVPFFLWLTRRDGTSGKEHPHD